jgi:transcriptional regulator with XRE-family HTH domain
MPGYGKLLREARDAKGWSQEEAGEHLGVSGSTVSRWENEEGNPPQLEHLNRIAAELNVSVEMVLRLAGIQINPPAAQQLPPRLVSLLLSLGPQGWDAMVKFLEEAARSGARR